MKINQLKSTLDEYVDCYNQTQFIETDPISIPHRFQKQQDIEIAGFWVAMLSWGQRVTIINKATELMSIMDNAPHDFIMNHSEKDRRAFLHFKHRTFQPTDSLYFLAFLQQYYQQNDSLEQAFSQYLQPDDPTTEKALTGFYEQFFFFT